MKWYKHDASANSDAKLRRVRLKYGMEGYGLYWYCLELIAQNVEKHNLSFELEHDAEIIAADTGIHFERVQEMMAYMVDLGLFESDNGIITCLKLAKRCDEYTAKLISQLEIVPTKSRQPRDKVRINRTEQTRTEQKKKRPPESLDWKLVPNLNMDAWNRWIEDRARRRLPKYKTTREAERLAKLPYDAQAACVDYSFDRYQGLVTEKHGEKTKRIGAESFDDTRAGLRKDAGLD